MRMVGRGPIPAVTVVSVATVVLSACVPLVSPGVSTPTPTPGDAAGEGPPLVQRGERLYQTWCQTCHGGATGGQMMDIPPRHNANGHTWHHPDCQLADIVLNGSGEMGEMMRRMMGVGENVPRMPAFRDKLTKDDVVAILAYIKTWWTDRQREFQARVTKEAC